MRVLITGPEVGKVYNSDQTGIWVEIGRDSELSWYNLEEAIAFAEQLRDVLIEEEAKDEQA